MNDFSANLDWSSSFSFWRAANFFCKAVGVFPIEHYVPVEAKGAGEYYELVDFEGADKRHDMLLSRLVNFVVFEPKSRWSWWCCVPLEMRETLSVDEDWFFLWTHGEQEESFVLGTPIKVDALTFFGGLSVSISLSYVKGLTVIVWSLVIGVQ